MDHEEMKKAVERALTVESSVVSHVSYTAIYRNVYEKIKTDQVSHGELHKAALQITNALWTIHLHCGDSGGQLEKSADAVVAVAFELFQ